MINQLIKILLFQRCRTYTHRYIQNTSIVSACSFHIHGACSMSTKANASSPTSAACRSKRHSSNSSRSCKHGWRPWRDANLPTGTSHNIQYNASGCREAVGEGGGIVSGRYQIKPFVATKFHQSVNDPSTNLERERLTCNPRMNQPLIAFLFDAAQAARSFTQKFNPQWKTNDFGVPIHHSSFHTYMGPLHVPLHGSRTAVNG